jgi:precorrin-2/cobalt-factor-2 C20-methyltransferase
MSNDVSRLPPPGTPALKTRGTLYGVGVGPGAPDLLTLRAVGVLSSVRVILAAASPKNDDSLALSIASPHLPEDIEIVRLDFPMTRNQTLLHAAWRRNARTVLDILMQGGNAAFLTLGDPLIYSTFGYLYRTLLDLDPEVDIRIVPGITSFQEAAAKSGAVLCEGNENLAIISGINGLEKLDNLLSMTESAVILKTYKNAQTIRAAVEACAKDVEPVFATRIGLEGESIIRDVSRIPEKPHYLSLLLVPPRRGGTASLPPKGEAAGHTKEKL